MEFNWGILFYIAGIYGFTRFLVSVKDGSDRKIVNWTPLESLGVTVFIYFFGQLVGGLLVYSSAVLWGWDNNRIISWMSDDSVGQFITVLLIESISMLLLFGFLHKRKVKLATIGLVKKFKISDVVRAVAYYVVYFISYLVVVKVVVELIPALDINQKQEIGFNSVASWQLPLVFMSLVILPPVVEEIIMRGFLYTGLKNKLPKIWAILITSLLFAVAHLQAGSGEKLLWIAALDTFILSIFLIRLKEKTGNLWAPIFLHSIKNFVAFLSIFIFKIV